MAKKKNNQPPPEPWVTCAECRHFARDTEGISRSQSTGEYFMGICTKGLTPDSTKKQFANKQRHCKSHRRAVNG